MDARLIDHNEHKASTVKYAYGAGEAAAMLGCSESAVRRAAKRLGVKKIAGRAVAGFVRFSHSPVDVSMAYHS